MPYKCGEERRVGGRGLQRRGHADERRGYNGGGEGVSQILLGRVGRVHAMMAGDHLRSEGFSAPTPAPPGRGAGWWELVEFWGGFLGRVVVVSTR